MEGIMLASQPTTGPLASLLMKSRIYNFTYQIVMSLRRWVVIGLNQSRFLSIALMTDLRISL